MIKLLKFIYHIELILKCDSCLSKNEFNCSICTGAVFFNYNIYVFNQLISSKMI